MSMHKLYTHQKSQACFLRPVNEDILTLSITFVWCATGVTSLDALQSPENSIQPDAYINQLSDLLVLD
jgi:hypothetical protein